MWEVEQTPEGGAKVVTEFTAEEVRAVLTLGLMNLFMNGLCPNSMVHHFEEPQAAEGPAKSVEEPDLFLVNTDGMTKQ